MKALVKTKKDVGHLEMMDYPIPQVGSGQILIKVRAVGVCGTDLHMRDGTYPCTPPVVLGHELSGTVEELGPGVTGFEVGDRVVPETYFSVCGHCHYCTTGHQNRCLSRKSIGVNVDGGMAEYVVVPAHRVHHLPENLAFEEGAAIEPYICCVQAVFGRTKLCAGDTVLVSGPGIMGLFCVQLLHALGCRVVLTGTAKDSERLQLGKDFGADEVMYVENENLLDKLREFGEGMGVVAAFECSGAPASVTTCINALRKGGTMIQVALPDKSATIDLSALAQAEKTITGSIATLPVWWDRGIQLLKDNANLKIRPLISETFPLTEWEKAFESTESRKGFKYVLIP